MFQTIVGSDRVHLRILAIAYFAVAAVSGLLALISLLVLAVGVGVMLSTASESSSSLLSRVSVWLIPVLGFSLLALEVAFTWCAALTSEYLYSRERYVFCLAMGGVMCAVTPLGTLLGVLTIVVLLRDSVRELFGQPPLRAPHASDDGVGDLTSR